MTSIDPDYLSDCHDAPVKVVGGRGDFHDNDKAITMHYECTECHEPCNFHPKPDKYGASGQNRFGHLIPVRRN